MSGSGVHAKKTDAMDKWPLPCHNAVSISSKRFIQGYSTLVAPFVSLPLIISSIACVICLCHMLVSALPDTDIV